MPVSGKAQPVNPQIAKSAARAAVACAALTLAMAGPGSSQGKTPVWHTPETKSGKEEAAAAQRFATRVAALLETAPNSKGQWGLLVVDGQTGETLYQQNADKY